MRHRAMARFSIDQKCKMQHAESGNYMRVKLYREEQQYKIRNPVPTGISQGKSFQ